MIIPVPGWAAIILMLLQLIAAVASSWLAWAAVPGHPARRRHPHQGAPTLAVASLVRPTAQRSRMQVAVSLTRE